MQLCEVIHVGVYVRPNIGTPTDSTIAPVVTAILDIETAPMVRFGLRMLAPDQHLA